MRLWWYTVVIFCIVIDQIIKAIALKLPPRFELCPSFNIIKAWNRGVSFSFLSAPSNWGRWLLIALTTGLCVFITRLLATAPTKTSQWGFSLLLGGAIGNIIDRVRFGAVFDFIDFYLYSWHFYTFNGADSFITLGALCVLWDYLKILKNKN